MSGPHRRPEDSSRKNGDGREPANVRRPRTPVDEPVTARVRAFLRNNELYWCWFRHRTGGRPLLRNPMCRTTDRLQHISAWMWFLVAAFLIPALSVVVAPRIVDSWASPPMRPTTAVVEAVSQMPAGAGPSSEFNLPRTYTVRMRWVDGSGSVHRGSVKTVAATHRGAELRVWATPSGDRVTATRPHDMRVLDLAVLVLNIVVDVSFAAYGLHRLLRWQLDRHRLRGLDGELGRLLPRR